MNVSFDYGRAAVRDLKIVGGRSFKSGKVLVTGLEVGGERAVPTRRFWKSFFARFSISDNVFRYFEPAEVFERVSAKAPDDKFRYCLERGEGPVRLLAVSSLRRPLISRDEICHLVGRRGGQGTKYDNGVVTSTHTPRSGERTFEIGGDKFRHQFVMETPVDGFGQPKIFLSFLRMICSNGAIGYARAFRSDISLGKDLSHCIARALDSYDNGDGYAALRQRFESAQKSWASVRECVDLHKTLVKLNDRKQLRRGTLLRDLEKLGGNLYELYGLANLDALSLKRQRVLPARCRVYDLLNFASEAGTHHATEAGNRVLQAYLGGLISEEYDLEGTAQSSADFSDFFIASEGVAPAMSLN